MKTRKPNKITKARKAIAESMKQQLDRVMMGMCKEAETNGIMEKLYKKSYPDIKKIVWNNPATIVILKTGEKGVCKVQSGDAWDCELGFWVAYAKALQTKRCFPAYLKELAYNPCNVYQWETSLVRSTVDIKATVPYCLAKKWGLVP